MQVSSVAEHNQQLEIQIKSVLFPTNTWLNNVTPLDYADTFMAEWVSDQVPSSDEMIIALFCQPPSWLIFLFRVRNLLVKMLRITAETKFSNGCVDQTKNAENLAEAIREGRSYGMFSVPFKSQAETVLLGVDRHLDFYLSIQVQSNGDRQQRLSATTMVRYKNKTGRLYFFFVRPFHRLIVPVMMKKAIKKLERENPKANPA
jgi:hypothetical protein